jgi:hypothetical protein
LAWSVSTVARAVMVSSWCGSVISNALTNVPQ